MNREVQMKAHYKAYITEEDEVIFEEIPYGSYAYGADIAWVGGYVDERPLGVAFKVFGEGNPFRAFLILERLASQDPAISSCHLINTRVKGFGK